jgi:hypothetical protein
MVVGGVVAAVLTVSGFVSVASSVDNDFATVATGSFGLVEVTDTTEHLVMVEYNADVGLALVDVPRVVVIEPDGREVRLDRGVTQQSYTSGSQTFVLLGSFEPARTGAYRVVVGQTDSPLVAGVVVGPDPVATTLVPRLIAAVVVAAVSLMVAVVATLVLVVLRRRRTPVPTGGS